MDAVQDAPVPPGAGSSWPPSSMLEAGALSELRAHFRETCSLELLAGAAGDCAGRNLTQLPGPRRNQATPSSNLTLLQLRQPSPPRCSHVLVTWAC